MRSTFRLGLLTSSLLLSLGCAALAQSVPSLRGANPSSEGEATKDLRNLKGAPATGRVQTATRWKEPTQAEVRIEEQLPNTLPRDTALEEAGTQNVAPAPGADAMARERQRADALALELAVMRQELEVTKQHAAIALQEAAETAQVHAAELGKAQAEEHQRAETLAQELAAARQELEAARAQVLALQQEQQKAAAIAVQEEQKKSAKLARSLAAARKELKVVKQQGGAATKQPADTARAELGEQGDAWTPEATTVRLAPEAVTRSRTKMRQGTATTDEDVKAALGTSAVTRQPPIAPRQFEWE